MKNLKKSFQTSFIFGASILIGSGIGYSLISQQAQSYNDVNTQTAYEQDQTEQADSFVNDLNSLQTGETYTLTSDVDLSYLTDPNDHVQLASGVTIDGNGYTISNRTINSQTTFNLDSIDNLKNAYFFNSEITDSTITNLTFENFYFPIYGLNNSDLNNVNYINTDYSDLTFNLNSYYSFIDSGGTYQSSQEVGLFVNYMINASSINYSTIQNITFSNNTINNKRVASNGSQFSMIAIAPIGRATRPIGTTSDPIVFSNIYVNDISYEGNTFLGEKTSNGQTTSSNYGDASSIYFSPLLAQTQGETQSDSYLTFNMNHIIFNDINFGGDNNSSAINNTFGNGVTSGIYFSFYPPITINTSSTLEDIFIFNSTIEAPDEDNPTVYYTGYVNSLGNLPINSDATNIITHNIFTYQINQFDDYLVLGTDVLSGSSNLNSMQNNIIFYDSENGETNPELGTNGQVNKSYFDSKYWTINKQSLNDPHLSLINQPSATNLSLVDKGDNVGVNFTFRAGTQGDVDNNWNLSLIDQTNTVYWTQTMSSSQVATFEISKETLFDPNNSFELQINPETASYAQVEQEFNSTYYLPKFENTSNLYNSTTQQIDLSFSVDDPYELLTTSSISLYKDDGKNDKLIETKSINPYSNVITNSQTKEIQTYIISTSTTFDVGSQNPKDFFSSYYFDLDVNYSFKGQTYSMDDYYLNIDEENSDVRFSQYEESQVIWYWFVVLVLFLILVAIAIVFAWLWFRKRNQSTKLTTRFEEVTGIQLFE